MQQKHNKTPPSLWRSHKVITRANLAVGGYMDSRFASVGSPYGASGELLVNHALLSRQSDTSQIANGCNFT